MHTQVSSVQRYGQFKYWPFAVIYVGMPGNASRAFGIPDRAGIFGKPWECLQSPLGWQTAYVRYLVARMAADPKFELAVKNLHGMTLLCWCEAKPNATHCHAHILAEFVELLNGHGGE